MSLTVKYRRCLLKLVQTVKFLLKRDKNYAQFAGGHTYINFFNNINYDTLVTNTTNVFQGCLVTVVAKELLIDNVTIFNTCTYVITIITWFLWLN
jgi:hypothetical protein